MPSCSKKVELIKKSSYILDSLTSPDSLVSPETDDNNDIQIVIDTTSSLDKSYTSYTDDDEINCSNYILTEANTLLNMEKVIKSGYLLKKGKTRRTWKKRWFVLKSTKLAMYKDSKEYKLLNIIDLNDVHKVIQIETKNKYKNVFGISTAEKLYYFKATTQQDTEDWLHLLDHAFEKHTHKSIHSNLLDEYYAKDIIASYKETHSLLSFERPALFNRVHQPLPSPPHSDLSSIEGSDNETNHNHNSDDEHSAEIVLYTINEESIKNKVLMEGYLFKLSRMKAWKKRWFVLRTDTINYYKDDKEYAPHKVIQLSQVIDTLEIDPVSKNKQHCFKLIIKGRRYVLCADSVKEMDDWLNALTVATSRAETKSNILQPKPSKSL